MSEPQAWARVALEAMEVQGRRASVLAGELGLSPRAFSARLAGRVRPLTTEIARLADLLGLPVQDLVGPSGGEGSGPALELLTERDRRVYAATRDLAGGEALDPGEVRAYVEEVLESGWWQRWVPGVGAVQVEDLPGADPDTPAWHEATLTAAGVTHVLHIPPWAARPLTILHELAHVAAHPLLWAKPHGPQFLRLWVDLVGDRMGRRPAGQLRGALREAALGLDGRPAVASGLARGREELERLLGSGGGPR